MIVAAFFASSVVAWAAPAAAFVPAPMSRSPLSRSLLNPNHPHPSANLNLRPSLTAANTLLGLEESSSSIAETTSPEASLPGLLNVAILPARQPLDSAFALTNDNNNKNYSDKNSDDQLFSILSWNILLPNSQDNWWNHKMYNPWVAMDHRQWAHRQALIQDRLLQSKADIICIQEADGDTFDEDFLFLTNAGYEACLHKKYRFRCATFFRADKFALEAVSHSDRVLITSLKVKEQQKVDGDTDNDNEGEGDNNGGKKKKSKGNNDNTDNSSRMLNVVNCHLSGGAAPERRLRQVHQALDQIRKWNNKASQALQKQESANRPNPKNIEKAAQSLKLYQTAGTLVCGDFNSDGNTGVRRLLVEGSVESEWREPQYPTVELTSKPKYNPLGEESRMVDAAELAYGVNVCDGDYGEDDPTVPSSRPPTYVVPNLAALLLSSPTASGTDGDDDDDNGLVVPPRTEFGKQVAQGLADTLGLQAFSQEEMEQAFESIDLDGNNHIDENEVQSLLESVYVATYGEKIRVEKEKFFQGFRQTEEQDGKGLTREQFAMKIGALQQQQQSQVNTSSDNNNNNNSNADFEKLMPKGVMDTLGMSTVGCEKEMAQAFDSIDLDGNNAIDKDEIQSLLETVYLGIYGEQIKLQKTAFFSGFQDQKGLSLGQFIEKLTALQQELEGGSEGSELVEVRTEADAQRMIARFSPLLKKSLDAVFDQFSDDGEYLTEDEINAFLVKANGELGRGGVSRHTTDILEKKAETSSQPACLTRDDWYGVFARELGEGKWWQVVYDLETCGVNIRPQSAGMDGQHHQHYQAWLDYVYFDSQKLNCKGFQEALTDTESARIYKEGDALPNEWHPSDHLPVAAIFSWKE